MALKALQDSPGDGPVWFHLHWLNALTDMQDDAAAVRATVDAFLRGSHRIQGIGWQAGVGRCTTRCRTTRGIRVLN